MTFCIITKEEAISKFRRAENKREAIRVIADLTVSKKQEVADLLGVKLIRKPPYVLEK